LLSVWQLLTGDGCGAGDDDMRGDDTTKGALAPFVLSTVAVAALLVVLVKPDVGAACFRFRASL
jgi:hypothetical protein